MWESCMPSKSSAVIPKSVYDRTFPEKKSRVIGAQTDFVADLDIEMFGKMCSTMLTVHAQEMLELKVVQKIWLYYLLPSIC